MSKRWCLLLSVATVFLLIGLVQLSRATSQWSRKYEVGCTMCHTSFPKLNQYGEQFMRNGYQVPGSEDGDEEKKVISDNLVIDELGNFFGVRLNFTPVEFKTNHLEKNGEKTTSFRIGKPNWIQFFTAGSIYKNVSIFIETPIETESKKAYSKWFRLGFHNLLGTSLLNARVGNTSPLEWTAASGRLRMIPPLKLQILSGVKSSGGKGEDSIPLAPATPAITLYGYQGPVLYEVGIGSGAILTDPNNHKNYWGTLRLETDNGSAVSFHITRGYDTADTATDQKVNNFIRLNPAIIVRWKELEFMTTVIYGEDDNWTLVKTNPKKNSFWGESLHLGYIFSPKWYGILQYDRVDSDDDATLNYSAISSSIWYHTRQNMKLGLTAQQDLESDSDKQKSAYMVTIRTMF